MLQMQCLSSIVVPVRQYWYRGLYGTYSIMLGTDFMSFETVEIWSRIFFPFFAQCFDIVIDIVLWRCIAEDKDDWQL